MKTTNQMAEHIGIRPSASEMTASPWRRLFVFGGGDLIDNSTDVSAGRRRHR